jgi:hypothetical protein
MSGFLSGRSAAAASAWHVLPGGDLAALYQTALTVKTVFPLGSGSAGQGESDFAGQALSSAAEPMERRDHLRQRDFSFGVEGALCYGIIISNR